MADSTDQLKVLLSSADSNFTDCSVQLSIPDDELFDFQDALTMEAVKLITKCQETRLQENSLENLTDSTSFSSLSNAANPQMQQTGQVMMDGFQVQNDSGCANWANKAPAQDMNAAKATITNREDGKSVINIPLVVKKEDLTHGTSVELPIKIGDDQNPKFVVQINLPRCLDCKNEPSCECCKTTECSSSNLNVALQNDKNNKTGNQTCTTVSTMPNETGHVPIILDPSLTKDVNSLL